jgi:hypothetical protein
VAKSLDALSKWCGSKTLGYRSQPSGSGDDYRRYKAEVRRWL